MTNSRRSSPGLSFLRQTGFTVMELLMGIAVLAILTTLAVPAFTQLLQNNRLDAQANEMVASFQFARSEAVKRGSWVEICASADGDSCGGDFSNGWIAHADPATMVNPDEENPLRVWSGPGDDLEFDAQQTTARFLASGCFDHDQDNQRCSAPDEQPFLKLSDSSENENIRPRLVQIALTGNVLGCREDKVTNGICEQPE